MKQVTSFEGQMNNLFREAGCLEATETTVLMNVGWAQSSEAAVNAEFGEVMVKKASAA